MHFSDKISQVTHYVPPIRFRHLEEDSVTGLLHFTDTPN
jgi:hypothetical protein